MAEFATAERTTKNRMERVNRTNIPTAMKERIERTSGVSLDDVKVHYHSDRPGLVGALAYTQGNQVYVGAGQERHLPHELGHVVQQKMGMVRPTRFENGYAVNDDGRLERQADEIGKGNVSFGGSAGKGMSGGWPIQMATATLKGTVQREEISATGESAGGADESVGVYSFTCAPIDGAFSRFHSYLYVDIDDLDQKIQNIRGKAAISKRNTIQQARFALAHMKRFSKNAWKGTTAYETCGGYAGDLGISLPEKSRSPFYCAEPHALREIMPKYKEKRKAFLESIKDTIREQEGERVYEERVRAVEDASYGQAREKAALKRFLRTLKFSGVNHEGELLSPCKVCQQWVWGLEPGESKLNRNFIQSVAPDV